MKSIAMDDIIVNMVDVNSSNVAKIGYNEEWTTLVIEMLNGHLFYYLDVPKNMYDELLATQTNIPGHEITSIGSYMNRFLKGYYRFIQMA